MHTNKKDFEFRREENDGELGINNVPSMGDPVVDVIIGENECC